MKKVFAIVVLALLVLTQSKNGVRNVDKGYWAIDHFIYRGRSEVTHWMQLPGVEV